MQVINILITGSDATVSLDHLFCYAALHPFVGRIAEGIEPLSRIAQRIEIKARAKVVEPFAVSQAQGISAVATLVRQPAVRVSDIQRVGAKAPEILPYAERQPAIVCRQLRAAVKSEAVLPAVK